MTLDTHPTVTDLPQTLPAGLLQTPVATHMTVRQDAGQKGVPEVATAAAAAAAPRLK